MLSPIRIAALVIVTSSATQAVAAQQVHRIKIEAEPGKELYRFDPAQVTARPGDVLLYRVATGSPHSIVFENRGLSERSKEAINGSMPRRVGDLSSPLLTREGDEYRILVPQLPPGTYQFYCLPHRAYDERGTLRIRK